MAMTHPVLGNATICVTDHLYVEVDGDGNDGNNGDEGDNGDSNDGNDNDDKDDKDDKRDGDDNGDDYGNLHLAQPCIQVQT